METPAKVQIQAECTRHRALAARPPGDHLFVPEEKSADYGNEGPGGRGSRRCEDNSQQRTPGIPGTQALVGLDNSRLGQGDHHVGQ
jgi:hypothetical protein